MQFIHQPLTWGFLLVLLPLLIHLINLMRHRRVQWAAMEFLLASYRKHRRWVWLKQLLLLLLRMLAVAAVVAMLAKLVTRDQWSLWFGNRTTHHFVLLDDSLSMSERGGTGSAFDRAHRAIAQLTTAARGSDHLQQLTLIRYSRAAHIVPTATSDTTQLDLNAAPINEQLANQWHERGSFLQASQLAVGIQPALELAERLIDAAADERCVLHVVSDFRSADWQQPAELRDRLAQLAKTGTEIQLVRCVNDSSANLAVTTLVPATGTQAAGVPLLMTVAVKNFGSNSAQQVRLQARTTLYPTSPQGTESAPQVTELPDLLLERIESGETVTRQFQVFFPTPGQHRVEVELPADPLTADNRRWCVVRLQAGESALIIDGHPEERSAYYLESIFRPGTKAKTGIIPVSQTISYLRDATLEELLRHQAIYLLDPPPLDTGTLETLQRYVRQGGGLACFLGPNQNSSFYSSWYDQGVFPARLQRAATFQPSDDAVGADVQFWEHPIFRALSGQRNPFATAVRIQQYVATAPGWLPTETDDVEVLASLRDGAPLVIERRVGNGHVIAYLTTLAPEWNNWALEPSFIVMALQLHGYLAQSQRPRVDQWVGETLTIQFASANYQSAVLVTAPDAATEGSRELAKTAVAQGNPPSDLLTATLTSASMTTQSPGDTEFSGVYDTQLQTLDGQLHHQRSALNVDARESDLAVTEPQALRSALDPVPLRIVDADQQLGGLGDADRNSWSELLLAVLVGALLLEQTLSYFWSYHPTTARAVGGNV